MTQDDPGQPTWQTLTQAAASTGHSREALRQRVRRGTLAATRGNDGQLRVNGRDLADLPPPDAATTDDQGQPGDDAITLAMDVLRSTVDDLRSTLDNTQQALDSARLSLDKMQADRLDDHGRAERATALAEAEGVRAARAEARADQAEAALAQARTPLVIRLIQAIRPAR